MSLKKEKEPVRKNKPVKENELVKNRDYEITIEDMGNDGEGIGHIDGMTVFVKDTVIGDVALIKIIKVKKSIAYGRLVKLIRPSEFRVDRVCPKARSCGGCVMQHVSYERQKQYKWDKEELSPEDRRSGGSGDYYGAGIWHGGSLSLQEQGPVSCGQRQGWQGSDRILCGKNASDYGKPELLSWSGTK